MFLWLARLAVAGSLLVTLVLAGGWVESYRRPIELTRTRWNLSATEDDWTKLRLQLLRGSFMVAHEHQTQVAFTGNFISDVPFALDRTDPAGVEWGRSPLVLPQIDIGPGFGDGPRALERWGLSWRAPRELTGGFGPYQTMQAWIRIDLWLPTALAGMLSGLSLAAWRRAGRFRRRSRAGLCASCGYDLRGSPDRCPECGTVARASGG